MSITFVNRVKEMEFLSERTERVGSFVVLYGRRRVGKSELIKQFLKNKKSIYWASTQEVEAELMKSFSLKLADHFKDAAIRANPFNSFTQVMEYLKEKNVEKTILAIDEFPYLVDANKAIPSILQKYWDNHLKEKGLSIILCGSSIGSMETEVLGRKSPLYGRRTGQWKLDPLSFPHARLLFPAISFKQWVELYAMAGGIPLYLHEIDPKKSALDNATEKMARRGALMYQEVDFLLKEELREPKTYFSLLKEMTAGKNSLNELANALQIPSTVIGRYLETLIELGLIEIIKPVTLPEKSKKTGYVLKDNYISFWFQFVYPFLSELDSFQFSGFKENFEQNFNAFVGKKFEQICMEALRVWNPIDARKVGKWWGTYREGSERKTAEIDVVCIKPETEEILFGECKWKEDVNAQSLFNALKEKARKVDWHNEKRKEHYILFAKSFSKKTNEENVTLIDLPQLEKIFRTREDKKSSSTESESEK